MKKLTKFQNIINDSKLEQDVQLFLEDNPNLISNGKFVAESVVVRKLKLGLDFITDFAFVEPTSGGTFLHLIEIKNPNIKIFKNQIGDFSKPFNDAITQVNDWRHWFRKYESEIGKILDPILTAHRTPAGFLIPRFHLIIGRRSEVNANQKTKSRWQSCSDGIINLRTYDGFIEDRKHILDMDIEDQSTEIRCVRYSKMGFVDVKKNSIVLR